MCLKGGKFEAYHNLIHCQKTKYHPSADTLKVYKFRAYLWISYFFDDITTIFGL